MKTIAPSIARTLLGLVFFVFGLNGFFHFLPMPPPPPSAAGYFQFLTGSYLFSLVKGTEVTVGLLLLSNRFVPLALTLLAPVTVNIVLFHSFLEPPQTLALPLVLVGLQLYLAWVNRSAFAALLVPRAARGAEASPQGRREPERSISAAGPAFQSGSRG